MKQFDIFKVAFVILVCTFCSAAVRAQLSVPYVVASFLFDSDSDTEKIVKNDIAVTDNVEIICDGDWDFGSGYFMIPTTASLTFKAEEFQNICVIQLLTYHYDDAGDYPVKCTIVDAKGRGIMGVSDLTTGLTPTINTTKKTSQDDQADIYTFNFGNDTELSEVTLRFSADLYIDKASVSLNVDPVVSDQDLTLYADDTVPFEKKTNLSSVYQCYVSNNKDLEDDDLEDRFRDIPAAGDNSRRKSRRPIRVLSPNQSRHNHKSSDSSHDSELLGHTPFNQN